MVLASYRTALAAVFVAASLGQASAQDASATNAIERIDQQVLGFAKNFQGELYKLSGALMASQEIRDSLKLSEAEWKALAAKVDADLATFPVRDGSTLGAPVFSLDLSETPPTGPIKWNEMPEEMLLILRAYDVQHTARLGASVALPAHLSSSGAFARETIVWAFTSIEVFKATVENQPVLGSSQGNWTTTATFERSPRGLIRLKAVKLYPRYQ